MQIAVIEGDDAAPEAMKPSVELIDSLSVDLGLGIKWVYPLIGEPALSEYGTTFPDQAKVVIDQ